MAAVRIADANAARAQAEFEIARAWASCDGRAALLYGRSFGREIASAQRALDEAESFVAIAQKREIAGEAANADVIKARLVQQQRQRELADANLANEKGFLELGILLYPDPTTKFKLATETAPPVLPEQIDVGGGSENIQP